MVTPDALDGLKVYLVGGAVRDRLMGLPVKDRDWVVVGSNSDQMISRGFKPVGQQFPVFLHPHTREEYALARTERKTGPGYTGFEFCTESDITIEQDLSRRDLTINAIAQYSDGTLIDPFGGETDLENAVLRHVSPAFTEDPVRLLRVARFKARFAFSVAPETRDLMRAMVANGESAPGRNYGMRLAQTNRPFSLNCCAKPAPWRAYCPRSTPCSGCRRMRSITPK